MSPLGDRRHDSAARGGHVSAEIHESFDEVWTRWQGHVINGVYPLGRYLGCSDHSGVFLTPSAAPGRSEIAIKLVPANRALVEFLLPRWRRAAALAHPHLLRLVEWGGCQLGGSPHLYAVMEYADQTLAQLLMRRALTDDEAREMLIPVLDALGFLHERDLVQGRLKPANILVVGDRLKLASDTIRRIGETRPGSGVPTGYDPPEAMPGTGSPAGDVWALGVSLCEALARRPPSTGVEHGGRLSLPSDLSPVFRDVVARCLSLRPQDRPGVPELVSWAQGQTASTAPAAIVQKPPEPEANSQPGAEVAAPARSRTAIHGTLIALLAVGLVWSGLHFLGTHTASASRAIPAPPGALPSGGSGAIGAQAASRQAPVPGIAVTGPHRDGAAGLLHPLREVIPDVPLGALRTIRGHIKIWVRVTVDRYGSVSAAVADRPGPSRYFQRLATQAAKRWTFPPVDTSSRRLVQVRFEFSREGVRGRAVPLG